MSGGPIFPDPVKKAVAEVFAHYSRIGRPPFVEVTVPRLGDVDHFFFCTSYTIESCIRHESKGKTPVIDLSHLLVETKGISRNKESVSFVVWL